MGTRYGGRTKGTPNKLTQGAKENVMQVFEMLGGAKGFCEWANENKTEFYKHYAKLIPVQGSEPDGSHKLVHKVTLEIVDSSGS